MKFFILFYYLLLTTILSAQTGYDVIHLPNLTINGHAILFKSKEYLLQLYGKPIKISKYISGFTNEKYKIFQYKDISFEINPRNQVSSFKFLNDQCYVSNHKIKIGWSANELEKLYPKSFKKSIYNGEYKRIRVSVEGEEDMYLGFTIHKKIISEIEIWYNY